MTRVNWFRNGSLFAGLVQSTLIGITSTTNQTQSQTQSNRFDVVLVDDKERRHYLDV